MPANDDVIFALSSGHGKSGVAVIRVSGKNLDFLPPVVHAQSKLSPAGAARPRPKPRYACLMDFYGIDKLIAIWFKTPNSFTGEDVVELHCHGGEAVINKIFEKLRGFGFRHAERGEFTRRAFLNGKMDLAEVDSMRALIDARTEAQRLRALKGLAGRDSDVYMKWRESMIELAALSAARIDYDAEDLPKDVDKRVLEKAAALARDVRAALKSRAHIVESGFEIVLAGPTNVGKSSLFNRLLGESRAIVSDIHGTTRDVVSAELEIDGYLVRLSDTAGLRDSKDEIEKIGISKTNEQIKNADLVLRVQDPHEMRDARHEIRDVEKEIEVINKSDLLDSAPPCLVSRVSCLVSAKTGEGMDELMDVIKQRIRARLDGAENDLAVNDRTRARLESAAAELEKVPDVAIELAAEHITNAADEIGMVLGVIGASEIYDSVFGQLCLGK